MNRSKDRADIEVLRTLLEKRAAELTRAGRSHVKEKNFVFPGSRRYPIHDEQHAKSALGFSKMHGSPAEQAAVRAAVARKYPGLVKEAEVLPYQQRTQWSCSAACLKAVLAHFGDVVPEVLLIWLIGTKKKRGAETTEIVEAAKKLGYPAHEKSLTLEEARRYTDRGIPLILDVQSWTKPGSEHYVVLTHVSDRHAYLMDPNTPGNLRVLTHDELLERWHGVRMAPPHEPMPRWAVIVEPKK